MRTPVRLRKARSVPGCGDITDADSPASSRGGAFLLEIGAAPFDPPRPRFCLLGGLDPADPFVARERGNVVPRRQCLRVGDQGLFQVRRQAVDHTAGNISSAQRDAHCPIFGFPLRFESFGRSKTDVTRWGGRISRHSAGRGTLTFRESETSRQNPVQIVGVSRALMRAPFEIEDGIGSA